MGMRTLRLALLSACASIALLSAQTPATSASSLVERVADTGFIQIEARSFGALDARQQEIGRASCRERVSDTV